MSDTAIVALTFALSYGLVAAYAVYLHLRLRRAKE
jgi:hypothetical protein